MASHQQAIKQIIRALLVWSPLWITTTACFGGLGFAYVLFFKSDVWLASQALLIRDEANGAITRLGRFENQDTMKAAQETIMAMARNQQVLTEAIRSVGPPKSVMGIAFGDQDYPSNRDVEDFASSNLVVRGPTGTEFGTTEVIFLDVKHDSREQALALNEAICKSLEKRMQQVRMARADGIVSELTHARENARAALDEATARIREIENDVGTDLSDLRGMTDTIAGGGVGRNQLDQLNNEKRTAELAHQQLLQDIALLDDIERDPSNVFVAPSNLLNAQPGLRRMREGLVDAQLQASQLAGRYTDEHPAIAAAIIGQQRIIQRFSGELKASRIALQKDADLAKKRIEKLVEQESNLRTRIQHLSEIRADYANRTSEVRTRSAIVEQVERDLAAAESARSAAMSTSLITRLDPPTLSDKPLGPGKSTVIAACAAAGFSFGVGLILLFTPLDGGASFGRRWSDSVGAGRREVDRVVPTSHAAPNVIVVPTEAVIAAAQTVTGQNVTPANTIPYPNQTPPQLSSNNPTTQEKRVSTPVNPKPKSVPESPSLKPVLPTSRALQVDIHDSEVLSEVLGIEPPKAIAVEDPTVGVVKYFGRDKKTAPRPSAEALLRDAKQITREVRSATVSSPVQSNPVQSTPFQSNPVQSSKPANPVYVTGSTPGSLTPTSTPAPAGNKAPMKFSEIASQPPPVERRQKPRQAPAAIFNQESST